MKSNPKGYGIGRRFGRLTIASREGSYAIAICDCGTQKRALMCNLAAGVTQSCGCLHLDTVVARSRKHGLAGTRIYNIWRGMISRCHSPTNIRYCDYGGRGINVFPEWQTSIVAFVAHMGPRPSKHHSVDRINNDGNYEPGNVRWATPVQQARNTRQSRITDETISRIRHLRTEGMRRCEIAEATGVSKATVGNVLFGSRLLEMEYA